MWARLRFRRHLAALGLVWLLHELAERPARAHRKPVVGASAAAATAASNRSQMGELPARFPSRALDEQVAGYYARQLEEEDAEEEEELEEDAELLLALKAALRTAPMLVHSTWGYASPQVRQLASGPQVDADRCVRQLAHLSERLQRGPHDRPLAALMDTYGRVASQLLRGNTKWLGSRQACLASRLPSVSLEGAPQPPQPPAQVAARIKFRYCLAALAATNWPQPTGPRSTQTNWTNFGVHSHHLNRQLFFYRLGVCLPEACDSRVLEERAPEVAASLSVLARHNLAPPFNQPKRYQLIDWYCLPDDQSPVRQLSLEGRAFLALASLWLLLVVGLSSTPASGYLWRIAGPATARCLSLAHNWRHYTRHLAAAPGPAALAVRAKGSSNNDDDDDDAGESEAARTSAQARSSGNRKQARNSPQQVPQTQTLGAAAVVDTSCLNALKVLCLGWLMAAHCVMYLGSVVANPGLLAHYARSPLAYALSVGAIYITEVFFIISGCLTSHLLFTHHNSQHQRATDQPTRRLPWRLLALNRYLRILPLYLLVYAYVRLVGLKWGGGGAQWDYAVSENSQRRQCSEESWWPILTLTTNYLNLYEHCILAGWYLSVDMQFTLLAIPLLLLLQWSLEGGPRRPLIAYLVVALAILSSASAAVLSLIFRSDVDLSYLLRFVPHSIAMLTGALHHYTNPILRFRAYAMGLLTGHLLHLYRTASASPSKCLGAARPDTNTGPAHKWAPVAGCLALCFGIMFGPLWLPAKLIVVSHDVTSLLMVLSASLIDLGVCALIFLLCTGRAPASLLALLRAPAWSLLSSLSLPALLVHTELIIVLTSQLEPAPSVGYALVLFVFAATLLLTYPIALTLHLCFELPVNRLITRALTPRAQASASTGAGQTNNVPP